MSNPKTLGCADSSALSNTPRACSDEREMLMSASAAAYATDLPSRKNAYLRWPIAIWILSSLGELLARNDASSERSFASAFETGSYRVLANTAHTRVRPSVLAVRKDP